MENQHTLLKNREFFAAFQCFSSLFIIFFSEIDGSRHRPISTNVSRHFQPGATASGACESRSQRVVAPDLEASSEERKSELLFRHFLYEIGINGRIHLLYFLLDLFISRFHSGATTFLPALEEVSGLQVCVCALGAAGFRAALKAKSS